MKKKFNAKKVAIGLLCGVSLGCAAIGLTACGGDESDENPTGNYTFENSVVPTDAGVTIDGAFNESFWNDTTPYFYRREITSGYFVSVTAKAHFGENGIYLAFDVDDSKVNFNSERKTTQNTGLEVMFASSDVTHIENKGFRYIINAGGLTSFGKYVNNKYIDWQVGKAEMPRSKTVLKGGEIGTEECTGYQSEIFLPKEIFGEETPEGIGIYLGLICTFSSTPASSRVWTSLNGAQVGADWYNPQEWYLFNDDGFICNKVTLKGGSNGTLTSDFNYSLKNMKTRITVKPDEGYRISSFTANGADISDQLFEDNGNWVYEHKGNGTDVEISAEFDAVSENKYTLSGEIGIAEFENAPSTKTLFNSIESVKLSAIGAEYPVTYQMKDEKIVYSVTADEGDNYTLTVTLKSGRQLVKSDIDVHNDTTSNVNITAEQWPAAREISLTDCVATKNTDGANYQDDKAKGWDADSGAIGTKAFLVGGILGMEFSKGSISSEFLFLSYGSYNGQNALRHIRVALNNTDGNYSVKTVVTGVEDKSASLTTEQKQYYETNNGGYVIVAFEGTTLKVYLYNGSSFTVAQELTVPWLATAPIINISIKKEADSLNRTLTLTEGKVRTDDLDIENLIAGYTVSMRVDTENAKGITDLTGHENSNIKFGDKVTVTFKAVKTATVSATLNGREIALASSADGNNVSYTCAFTAGITNNLVITAFTPAVAGEISVSDGEFTAQQIKDGIKSIAFIAENSQEYSGTLVIKNDKLEYSADITAGTYTLKIVMARGNEKTDSVIISEGGVVKNISITVNELLNARTITTLDCTATENGKEAKTWDENVNNSGLLKTNTFIFGGKIGVNYSAGTISSEIVFMSWGNYNGKDALRKINIALINTDGNYTLKTTGDDIQEQVISLTENQKAYYAENQGGYVIVTLEGATLKVYLYNGTSFELVQTCQVVWHSTAPIVNISIQKNSDEQNRPLTLTGGKIRTNDTDMERFLEELMPSEA